MNTSVVITDDFRMSNPVMPASGCFDAECFARLYEPSLLDMLGAITTKSCTLEPRDGNDQPRIIPIPYGLMNSIGLHNPGLEAVIEKTRFLLQFDPPVLFSIAGKSIDEYVEMAIRLNSVVAICGLEVNASCPNVAEGMTFGCESKINV